MPDDERDMQVALLKDIDDQLHASNEYEAKDQQILLRIYKRIVTLSDAVQAQYDVLDKLDKFLDFEIRSISAGVYNTHMAVNAIGEHTAHDDKYTIADVWDNIDGLRADIVKLDKDLNHDAENISNDISSL